MAVLFDSRAETGSSEYVDKRVVHEEEVLVETDRTRTTRPLLFASLLMRCLLHYCYHSMVAFPQLEG